MKESISLDKAIHTVNYNPFFLSELLLTTFYGYKKNKIDFFDIYLILPLLLFEKSMIALQSTNASGSIYTVFLRNNNISTLIGLEKRISRMKKITNLALHIALENNWIHLDLDTMSIIVNNDFKKEFEKKKDNKKGIYKSAYNLGKLLTKQVSKDNYLLLEVKTI